MVIADSAFASVKSAVALRKELGLYFMGMVKTAHRQFPKTYLQKVPMATRDEHVVCTATKDNINLRAVGWNDGRKNRKTKEVACKTIVGSCGTTLNGNPHRKSAGALTILDSLIRITNVYLAQKWSKSTLKEPRKLMSITICAKDAKEQVLRIEQHKDGIGGFSRRISV